MQINPPNRFLKNDRLINCGYIFLYDDFRDKFEIKLGDGTKSKREFGKYITLVEKYSMEFDDFSSGLEINKVGEEKKGCTRVMKIG